MRLLSASLAALIALPSLSPAVAGWLRPIEIRRNTVIEVKADQDLNVKKVREGDRFSVTVSSDFELPNGSQLYGEVIRVEPRRGDEKAYMDLEFKSVQLPDGSRQNIQAIPIALNNKAIRQDRDGRMYADAKKVRNEYYVLGGLVGGLVLGSILKKPFEGAFIGTLAGIIFGESERQKNKNADDVVLKRGTKLGAVVLEDTTIAYDERNWRGGRDDDRNRNDDGRFDVRYQNNTLRYESREAPYGVGRTVMVPAQTTARQLGLTVDRVGDRLYIENADESVRLSIGAATYRASSQRGDLSTPVEERNNVVYVPIEVFTLLVKQPLYLNGSEVQRPIQ